MEYVNFGRSGLKVSRLAYGLGLRGQDDAGEAERAIERGIELGINFIDCANIYGLGDGYATRGTSEQLLAPVLKRHRDDLRGDHEV
ncbi:MAG: aldo/keto reductase, partial [Gemmatimonadetes bacterium]|nr:aldo/keto reductase [Gemmatimonadota bacterium]